MPSTSLDRSYPSAPITFADVPEVQRFEARFHYNFFEADESINDHGIEIDRVDDEIERKLERSAARFVRFSFKPVNLSPNGLPFFNVFRGMKDFEEVAPTPIEVNQDKIVFEQGLTNTSYTGVRFQDNMLDEKLFVITSGAVARRVKDFNRGIENQFRGTERRIRISLLFDNVNLFDAAKLLSTGQGTREAKLIVQSLNNLKAINARFVDDELEREKVTDRFARVKDVGIDVQINSKFSLGALQSVLEDPFSLFADEVGPTLRAAADEQAHALQKGDPGSIDANEYETFANPVSTRSVDVTSFDTRRRIVGYIIDKHEILSNGKTIVRDPIIVQNGNATKAFDVDIAYGRRYVYSVRVIAEVEFVASIDGEDEMVAATVLISSKPGHQQVVDTVEHVPPPPPADFNVDWDRTNRAARLTWSFPVNPQRDIKKFQVFRRKTIDEPFELIKEFDFDNSIVRTESGERVNRRLTEVMTSPRNYYIDFDFNRSSTYIYTTASIDAHGLTSNYSTQFEAKFDQAKNDIVKRLVSVSGAPKPYPNMYVSQDDVLVDVIRDSGHSQVEIYFDPEFLDVTDETGGRIGLLSTDKNNGQYCLQMINSDLQQGTVLDIVLKDRRKPILSRGKRIRRPRFANRVTTS